MNSKNPIFGRFPPFCGALKNVYLFLRLCQNFEKNNDTILKGLDRQIGGKTDEGKDRPYFIGYCCQGFEVNLHIYHKTLMQWLNYSIILICICVPGHQTFGKNSQFPPTIQYPQANPSAQAEQLPQLPHPLPLDISTTASVSTISLILNHGQAIKSIQILSDERTVQENFQKLLFTVTKKNQISSARNFLQPQYMC